jgi:hypothetical protein
LSIALDTWRADWSDRFGTSVHIGDYARKGVRMHYHFAKLYLCSHAFRGAYNPASTSYDISPDLEDLANHAVHSATSLLRNTVEDAEFQSFLNGLPAYYTMMLAFAVVFLLKVLAKDSPTVRIDRSGTYDLLGRLVATLGEVSAPMSKHHLQTSIANSLRSVVEKGRQSDTHTPTGLALPPPAQGLDSNTNDVNDFNPLFDPNDPSFITNFDFLGPQLDFDTSFMDYSNG